MNFCNLVTDCRTILNIWKQRWLSLEGKIQVFKSLIDSKPVYITTMKSLPQDVLDELQRMQKEFLWQGRRAKIKYSTMIGSYEKGGLNNVDLESKFQSLRIIWVRKILDKANFHPWMTIANILLQDLGGVNIFHTNLLITPEKRECLKKIPIFYKNVISTWERICIGTSCEPEYIYCFKVFGTITLLDLKVKPFLINGWNLKAFLWF